MISQYFVLRLIVSIRYTLLSFVFCSYIQFPLNSYGNCIFYSIILFIISAVIIVATIIGITFIKFSLLEFVIMLLWCGQIRVLGLWTHYSFRFWTKKWPTKCCVVLRRLEATSKRPPRWQILRAGSRRSPDKLWVKKILFSRNFYLLLIVRRKIQDPFSGVIPDNIHLLCRRIFICYTYAVLISVFLAVPKRLLCSKWY